MAVRHWSGKSGCLVPDTSRARGRQGMTGRDLADGDRPGSAPGGSHWPREGGSRFRGRLSYSWRKVPVSRKAAAVLAERCRYFSGRLSFGGKFSVNAAVNLPAGDNSPRRIRQPSARMTAAFRETGTFRQEYDNLPRKRQLLCQASPSPARASTPARPQPSPIPSVAHPDTHPAHTLAARVQKPNFSLKHRARTVAVPLLRFRDHAPGDDHGTSAA